MIPHCVILTTTNGTFYLFEANSAKILPLAEHSSIEAHGLTDTLAVRA